MDLHLTCSCGQYLIAPNAVFVERVQQHLGDLHPDRSYTVDQLRELARPA